MLDVLFIIPSNASEVYQDLATDYSAIEPPTWALLLAESCRSVGYKVGIIDALAEKLSDIIVCARISYLNPRLVCIVVYGQNVNSSSVSMAGATRLANIIKFNNKSIPISLIGSYPQALPIKTLEDELSIDFVFCNEGVYALRNVLKEDKIDPTNLGYINGICYRKNGIPTMSPPERIVSQDKLDVDLPGYAWDLLPYKHKPFDLYRCPMWHAMYSQENRTPYATLYTSLGCSFRCEFCLGAKTLVKIGKYKFGTIGFSHNNMNYDWKFITEVKDGDLVWDGTNWVETEGVVYNGEQITGKWKGVCITPDHLVYDFDMWKKASDTKDYKKIGNHSVQQPVYDLLNCGPKNRFTIKTEDGEAIVHNCMINILNRNNNDPIGDAANYNVMRHWSTEHVIKQIDKLVGMGVYTIRITDEMFLLNPKYYVPICEELAKKPYADKLLIWTYSRVDTVAKNPNVLKLLRKAGIRWLCLGIESGNRNVRLEVSKGKFDNVDIKEVIESVHVADIEVLANYLFGLPDDTMESMQETLDLSLELCTSGWNGYSVMPFPGSKLYIDSLKNGYEIPKTYSAYSYHSYDTLPMPTKYLTAAQVLKFRDEAFTTYHTNPKFLNRIKEKFGQTEVDNIIKMTQIKLKRKILGD